MANSYKRFSEDVQRLNPELFGPQLITSHAELNAAVAMDAKEERRSKFGNKKTKVGDITFDSKAEANRYLVLKAQEDAGEIQGLMTQVKIHLLEGFTYRGEKVRGITYTADFVYMIGRVCHVEDVKSVATARTKDFRLRWRLLQYLYKDNPDVICLTTGGD